jgi:hypothetical protein
LSFEIILATVNHLFPFVQFFFQISLCQTRCLFYFPSVSFGFTRCPCSATLPPQFLVLPHQGSRDKADPDSEENLKFPKTVSPSALTFFIANSHIGLSWKSGILQSTSIRPSRMCDGFHGRWVSLPMVILLSCPGRKCEECDVGPTATTANVVMLGTRWTVNNESYEWNYSRTAMRNSSELQLFTIAIDFHYLCPFRVFFKTNSPDSLEFAPVWDIESPTT